MALGERKVYYPEKHHIFSNKNRTYSPKYDEVTQRYNMSLDDTWNIVPLDGHKGRHTNLYHETMYICLTEIDNVAQGDGDLFIQGVGIVIEYLKKYPRLPYIKK